MNTDDLPQPQLSARELKSYLIEVFPQANAEHIDILSLSRGKIEICMKITNSDLRPGGTVSGPTMFKLSDLSAYLIVLAHVGKQALAVTTSLNINFLRKPSPGNLLAKCDLLKLGSRLAICELRIYSQEDDGSAVGPVAQATATYSVPPKK